VGCSSVVLASLALELVLGEGSSHGGLSHEERVSGHLELLHHHHEEHHGVNLLHGFLSLASALGDEVVLVLALSNV